MASSSGSKRSIAARSAKKGTGKASKKKSASKKTAKKAVAKKPAKRSTAKKAAAKKKTVKRAAAKKAPAKKKAAPKKAAPKKVSKKAASKATAPQRGEAGGSSNATASKAGKSGRKGITIVTPKPAKKAKAPKTPPAVPALTGSILGMGLGSGKPLIPSGPKAPPVSGAGGMSEESGKKPKSPFTKRQLDKYREILLLKRADLLGDIDSMENEALKSQSGSLSHLPQHMAEQGSETYEQSLSLDLAAADRVLLREIDAALKRIADRTYGLCERTGKPISKERLAELPWARYSIEAAREMERRTG